MSTRSTGFHLQCVVLTLYFGVMRAVQIRRAAGRIHAFQVCDWLNPLPDPLHGRDMTRNGVIGLPGSLDAVDDTGYPVPFEVEIFDEQIWSRAGPQGVAEVMARSQMG